MQTMTNANTNDNDNDNDNDDDNDNDNEKYTSATLLQIHARVFYNSLFTHSIQSFRQKYLKRRFE